MGSTQKRRMKVSTGSLDALPAEQIKRLVGTRPFVQQVDVVSTEDSYLLSRVAGLEAVYSEGRVKLTDVLAQKSEDTMVPPKSESQLLMLTTLATSCDDLWSVDWRGILTLNVCKETYEGLGIVGKPLPFKGHSDIHVIEVPLLNKTGEPSAANAQQKQKRNIEEWESRRRASGAPDWSVVYCINASNPSQGTLSPSITPENSQTRKVECEQKTLANVHTPLLSFKPRPPCSGRRTANPQPEEREDWDRDAMQLFEWAGLVALGSPRIQADDRPNPYIAVYESPQPSTLGSASHLVWKGLLSPQFTQSIVQEVTLWLQSSIVVNGQNTEPKFAIITVHSVPTSPVSYIFPGSNLASRRLPREDNEDTLCLLLGLAPSGEQFWTMVECLGQWDTRWG